MKPFDDLTGKQFGIWEVMNFDHMAWCGKNGKHGMSYYQCKCKKCGAKKLKARSDLTQNLNVRHLGCGEQHERII